MNSNIAFATILLISGLLFPTESTVAREARSEDALNQRLTGVEMLQDVTTRNAVATVLSKARISGGIANIDSCSASELLSEPKHSYSMSGLTVRQALDIIVSDDHRYRWLTKDTAINLVPSGGVSDVLRTKIARFEVNPDDSAISAGEKLFNTAEVKQALGLQHLTRKAATELIIGSAPPKIGQHLTFKDATVIDILNALVEGNKFPLVWQYTETSGNCKVTYDLEWPVGSSITHLK